MLNTKRPRRSRLSPTQHKERYIHGHLDEYTLHDDVSYVLILIGKDGEIEDMASRNPIRIARKASRLDEADVAYRIDVVRSARKPLALVDILELSELLRAQGHTMPGKPIPYRTFEEITL